MYISVFTAFYGFKTTEEKDSKHHVGLKFAFEPVSAKPYHFIKPNVAGTVQMFVTDGNDHKNMTEQELKASNH